MPHSWKNAKYFFCKMLQNFFVSSDIFFSICHFCAKRFLCLAAVAVKASQCPTSRMPQNFGPFIANYVVKTLTKKLPIQSLSEDQTVVADIRYLEPFSGTKNLLVRATAWLSLRWCHWSYWQARCFYGFNFGLTRSLVTQYEHARLLFLKIWENFSQGALPKSTIADILNNSNYKA